IADPRTSDFNFSAKSVNGSAQWADKDQRFLGPGLSAAKIHDRVVAAHNLPQISRSSKIVIHAAIEHHKRDVSASFHGAHASDIDTSRSGEEAAGLDDETTICESGVGQGGRHQFPRTSTQRFEIELSLMREVRNSQS